MIRACLLVSGLLFCMNMALARELTAAEKQCLAQIRAEVAFITSRVELIHREYEDKLDDAGLTRYESGEYSTPGLLDNSIRKYRLALVDDLRVYPQRYQQQLQAGQRGCLAEQLKIQGIGMIREFELNWSRALDKARQNAEYFRRLEQMN